MKRFLEQNSQTKNVHTHKHAHMQKATECNYDVDMLYLQELNAYANIMRMVAIELTST